MYKNNPHQKARKRLRLKEYDYSREWLYFVTISVQNKLYLLGEIRDNELLLSEGWKMVEKYWEELENKFDNIKLHNSVVMPNHFHGIVEIIWEQNVGVDLCVCPDINYKKNC